MKLFVKVFVLRLLLLYIVIHFAAVLVPASISHAQFRLNRVYRIGSPPFISAWGNFDSTYYVDIAARGYRLSEQPFFPLYPITIRFVRDITQLSYAWSGHFVAVFCFFVALIYALKLLAIDGYSRWKWSFLLLIFLFPTSYSYTAIYNDSLFFVFACASLYYVRRHSWIPAGIAGGLATLARLNGIVLVVPFIIEYFFWKTSAWDDIRAQWNYKTWIQSAKKMMQGSKKRWQIFAGMFIPLAFIGYLWFVEYQFGDWQSLFSSMKAWGQDKMIMPPQVVWRYIKIIFLYPTFKFNYWVAVLEFVSVGLYTALAIFAIGKIRLSYWLFFVCSIILPWLTGTFQGMPRYGLHIYPFFLSLLLVFMRLPQGGKILYTIVSVIGLVILVSLFTRGYFIA